MRTAILTTALFFIVSSAFAQDPTMVIVTGKCQTLKVGKADLSAHCDPKVMSTSYSSGRVGFYFTIADGSILTISGTDLPNPTPDTDQIRVDKVIFKIANTDIPPANSKASGKCSFGNPYKGKATIKCSGRLVTGEKFTTDFRTDGRKPR